MRHTLPFCFLLFLATLTAQAGAETVRLNAGWNPVALRTQRLDSLSAPGVTGVAFFDGTSYTLSAPTLEAFNQGDGGRRGCWVFASSATTLTCTGSTDGRGDFSQLRAGWNLVAFPALGEVAGSSLQGGIGTTVLARVYEAATDGNRPVDLSTGGRLSPGRAYWAFASAPTRLTWNTAGPVSPLPAVWSERPQVVLSGLVSSTTLALPEGGYRLYHFIPGEFVSRTSSDGLTFSNPVSMGLRAQPGTARDKIKEFSVIRSASGLYLMCYEAVDRQGLSRFFWAESADGITFQNRPGPLLDGAFLQAEGAENGFISAPDLVEVGGVLSLYYVAAESKTFLATSTDGGVTWTRRGAVSIRGFSGNLTDPDVVRLSDGRLALFALHDGRGVGVTQAVILSATSDDGLTFEPGPVLVYSLPGALKINPDVVALPDGRYWLYFAIGRDSDRITDLYRADSE